MANSTFLTCTINQKRQASLEGPSGKCTACKHEGNEARLALFLKGQTNDIRFQGTFQVPKMKIHHSDTAVVFIDPQNEVLSEKGMAWPLLHESLKENNTIENMERIFKAAKAHEFEVFISPHYFFPVDRGWKFNGPLETDEFKNRLFAREGVLKLDGLVGSGADWLERFKPYIEDGKTIVVSPHRMWGPETNDLVLQLRKRGIGKVVLGGMLANMCVESHLRELVEQGFQVAVAKDATAGPRHPEWGYGYTAALINFAFIAHAVLTTDQVVEAMARG